MKTLLSWLGNKDIENMQLDNHAAISAIAAKSDVQFDKIVILSNHREEAWSRFEQFIERKLAFSQRPKADVSIKRVYIESPIDYYSIAKETEKWIGNLSEEADLLLVNLTSGTSAMTTLSVLIGKGKPNVRFMQVTPENKVLEVDVPIDFSLEYTKSAARHIASKAASAPKLNAAFESITCFSDNMQTVVSRAKRLASSEVPALILGETGTGKEEMAKAIHKASLRANKPLKTVNCGALAPTLVESILFGHKKGAFTGANQDYPGVFAQADGGTLFLDEIGELSPDIQVKLLRALQQGEITPLGDTETKTVDVRLITATHKNLQQMVADGTFREDLFYRLAVGIITLPSLRQRIADLPMIVQQLTQQINNAGVNQPGYISKKISEDGMKFILSQSWPGNIRELWSTLNRAFLWSDKVDIGAAELADVMLSVAKASVDEHVTLAYHDKVDLCQITDSIQKKYIEAALKASGNVKKHATQMLGLKDHQTLTNWMNRLGIKIEK